MSSSFNRWFVRYGFRLGLGTLVLVGFLYYAQKQNLQSNFQWVTHTANLESELMKLSLSIQLQAPSDSVQTQIENIRDQIRDNPRQTDRLQSLSETYQRKLSVLLDPAFSKDLKQVQISKLDNQALVLINEMVAEEDQLLSTRESHSRSSIDLIDFPIAIGGLFACLLIYMANRITKRDLLDLLEKDRVLQKQASDLSRSKDALEMQTKYLNLTLDAMADGLVIMDGEKKPTHFNRAAREMLGLENEPLESIPFTNKLTRRDPVTLRELSYDEIPVARVFKGETITDFEVLMENPSSGLPARVLSFNSRPVLNEDGKIMSVVTVFRDVTEKRKIQNELIKAERAAMDAVHMKSQFLANMSHEIRTPMNGIIGMAELLSGTKLDLQQKSYLNLISESSQNLLTIINDILDFSKIEAGKLDIEKSDFNFSYSIDRTVQLLAHKAHEKHLVLLTYVSPEIPDRLSGDAGRIGQVLLNLVGNAVKFTEKGKVMVRTDLIEKKDQKVHIRFEVEDTGIGLDAQKIDKLFQPFSQADVSTSRRFGGTGLGLSICKQLVELMGGTMGVESNLGQGSTFWFTLPLDEAESSAASTQRRKNFPPENEILIFDADADSAQILTDYIASWKLRARHLKQVSDLQSLVEGEKDLTEFDLFMVSPYPQQESIERILQSLQKRVDRPRVTLILDDDNLDLQRHYRNLGVDNFLIRPVEQSGLYNHLMKMLSEDGGFDHLHNAKIKLPTKGADQETQQRRILIAEDNSVNQLIAQAFLKELGYSFHTVANGKEVLEALDQTDFDLILMDCQMPEMDGFEATKEIRKNISTTLPIVALTANAMKGDEEKCREAGMNGYLSKPFRKDQLKAVIEQYLKSQASEFDSKRMDMLKGYQDENGQDLRIALIETYLGTTPATLKELNEFVDQDLERFQRAAHSLKSSTAAVGGERLAQIFEYLENQPTTLEQRQQLVAGCEEEFENLKKILLQYSNDLKKEI